MSHFTLDVLSSWAPKADFWSFRQVNTHSIHIGVRHGVLEPLKSTQEEGAMITVCDQGGMAYEAISDLSEGAIRNAFQKALDRARFLGPLSLFSSQSLVMPRSKGTYKSPVRMVFDQKPLQDYVAYLHQASKPSLKRAEIVDSEASLWNTETLQLYMNSQGAFVEQAWTYLVPHLSATAFVDNIAQTRTLKGRGFCRQSGAELLEDIHFLDQANTLCEEAIELAKAPNCPSGTYDLLLDADQMMLQIHESIGHPLELDRILGDERNYAGTSFVTLDMFGHYVYGSPLLNVTYDPSIEGQFAAFAYDDEGLFAEKTFIIQNGILQKPLGGAISQQRSGFSGVANARACSWNRPPIDRMANLNVEPGTSSFQQMLSQVEKGIYMKTNASWSIDDSRNKFQFGCEWAQMIENGKLTQVVRNPNYRGISASFWRSLKAVGDKSTFEVLGTPFCGKGEPNQVIRVGHASPACLFENIEVFGGAS